MSDKISQFDVELPAGKDSKNGLALAAGGVGAAALTLAVTEQPAEAAGVADIEAMVGSLGTLAGAALAVALVPIGIYFAFKIVRRVMA